MSTKYSKEFYNEMKDANLLSARIIVPIVLYFAKIKSVVDVGSGTGIWIKAFNESGVKDVLAIDGQWVNEKDLVIEKNKFLQKDLSKEIDLKREFDLAVSLEVAEHIDKKYADIFVKNLTNLAPLVLFSAAIPLQGGTHHVNEQWLEYWSEKFKRNGYIPVDCIRRKIWLNKRVSFFYSQNIIFFIKESKILLFPKLQIEIENGNGEALSFVHPKLHDYYSNRWNSIVPILGRLPVWLLHFVKKII